MDDDASTRCATCGIPATNKCAGCKTAIYCGKTCQIQDWKTHRRICKDFILERRLSRVADVVQEAYTTFRKNTWDTPIVKVEVQQDKLIIHDGDPWANPQGFIKFPDDIVSNDRTAQLGVLTAWACNEPYAFMKTLISKLLSGLDNIIIDEIDVKLKSVPLKTVAIPYRDNVPHSNWPAYQHSLLRIASVKSNRTWVMDFAGGQYGMLDPLHDWQQYCAKYVEKVVSVYSMGTHKRILSELAKCAGAPTRTYGLVGKAAEELDKAVDTWEVANTPLSHLSALEHDEFQQQKAGLLSAIGRSVHAFITTNDFTAIFRKAKADDNRLTQERVVQKGQQLYNEANLLVPNVGGTSALTKLYSSK